jgi:hypothetical protein
MTEPTWDDSTLIIELLLDVQDRVIHVQRLLEGGDDEEEAEDDA